jgi:hypothetical protein
MTPHNPDDIAKLAYAIAKDMSAKDAREAVAGLFETTPDEAARAIARGRELARREGKAA